MKLPFTLKNIPLSLSSEIVRLARTNAVRFALQGAGALLRASAPLVLRAGEKLQAMAKDRPLTSPASSYPPRHADWDAFHPANGHHPGSYYHEDEDEREPSHQHGSGGQTPPSFF